MVTQETRIREVPVSNSVADNLVEVFSGFLNFKITKELVIFQSQINGLLPIFPLHMIQFNVCIVCTYVYVCKILTSTNNFKTVNQFMRVVAGFAVKLHYVKTTKS